jgi:uncharacterized membrane protein
VKRIPSSFEIVLSATLLVLGLYLLDDGSLSKTTNGSAIVIIGAVCLALSVVTLISAIRSMLWHRHMLKHSVKTHEHGQPRSV